MEIDIYAEKKKEEIEDIGIFFSHRQQIFMQKKEEIKDIGIFP